MIRKVVIRNFKCLRDVAIDLERFTVFVGANGSGKTSILEAIEWACTETTSVSPVNEAGSPEVECQTDDTGNAAASVHHRCHLLRLEPPELAKHFAPTHSSNGPPQDASFLKDLAALERESPAAWERLQDDMGGIVPIVQRLRTAATADGRPPALWADLHGGDCVPVERLSGGTLVVLAVLTVLHTPLGPDVLLLDDLGRGLHPKAQQELVARLRESLTRRPDLQIVATTHSPYLVDRVEPHELRMVALRDDGTTVCSPLMSHPKFEQWKNEMDPGELWSLFGEKWVLEQGVAA